MAGIGDRIQKKDTMAKIKKESENVNELMIESESLLKNDDNNNNNNNSTDIDNDKSSSTVILTESQKEAFVRVEKIVQQFILRTDSEPFHEPVNYKLLELYDYPKIIKEPMDLGTITTKILTNQYTYAAEIVYDIRLVWSNCMLYNTENSHFYILAKQYSRRFEDRYKRIKADFDVGIEPEPPKHLSQGDDEDEDDDDDSGNENTTVDHDESVTDNKKRRRKGSVGVTNKRKSSSNNDDDNDDSEMEEESDTKVTTSTATNRRSRSLSSSGNNRAASSSSLNSGSNSNKRNRSSSRPRQNSIVDSNSNSNSKGNSTSQQHQQQIGAVDDYDNDISSNNGSHSNTTNDDNTSTNKKNDSDNDNTSNNPSTILLNPKLDMQAKFASNLLHLTGVELGYIITKLEKNCPTSLEYNNNNNNTTTKMSVEENLEIVIDNIDYDTFTSLSQYANDKVIAHKKARIQSALSLVPLASASASITTTTSIPLQQVLSSSLVSTSNSQTSSTPTQVLSSTATTSAEVDGLHTTHS